MTAYDDLNPNKVITKPSDVKGKLTIGYGHTKNVYIGQKITESEAENLLMQDLQPFVDTVNNSVTVPLTVNMFNALVCLAYNIGSTAFKNSTLLKKLNANENINDVANEFTKWVKSGGQVLQGLVTRRNDEKTLFLTGFGVLEMFKPDGDILKKNANWIVPLVLLIIGFFFIRTR